MACPICDHTMQGLGDQWFWCSACGTVKQGQQTERYEEPTFIRAPSMVAYLFDDEFLERVQAAIAAEQKRRVGL